MVRYPGRFGERSGDNEPLVHYSLHLCGSLHLYKPFHWSCHPGIIIIEMKYSPNRSAFNTSASLSSGCFSHFHGIDCVLYRSRIATVVVLRYVLIGVYLLSLLESGRGSGGGTDNSGNQEKHLVQAKEGVYPGQTGARFECDVDQWNSSRCKWFIGSP